MNYQQINIGHRPDLESIEVNWPVGYIGRRLFPVSQTAEQTNGWTARTVVSDATPEESRTWSDNLTQTRISNTRKTYTCVKQEKRYVMTEDDVMEMGSLNAADMVGAMASRRSLMRKYEQDVYDKFLTSGRRAAAIELAAGSEFGGLAYAGNLVRRVRGQLSLVCSHQWLMGFIGLTAVATRLQSVAGLAGYVQARDAALSLQPGDVITSMLRTVLPFEQILVGDDDPWGANANYAAVCMVPNLEGMDPIAYSKMEAIYGLSKWFRPDPVNPENLIKIES
jgi:hypothetical protein